jgi:hypothetical protein
MGTEPTLAELVPHLSERGRVEVDLAFMRWENLRLQAQLNQTHEAHVSEFQSIPVDE